MSLINLLWGFCLFLNVTITVFFPLIGTSEDKNSWSESHDQKRKSDRIVSCHLVWHMTVVTEQHKLKEGEPKFVSNNGDR